MSDPFIDFLLKRASASEFPKEKKMLYSSLYLRTTDTPKYPVPAGRRPAAQDLFPLREHKFFTWPLARYRTSRHRIGQPMTNCTSNGPKTLAGHVNNQSKYVPSFSEKQKHAPYLSKKKPYLYQHRLQKNNIQHHDDETDKVCRYNDLTILILRNSIPDNNLLHINILRDTSIYANEVNQPVRTSLIDHTTLTLSTLIRKLAPSESDNSTFSTKYQRRMSEE